MKKTELDATTRNTFRTCVCRHQDDYDYILIALGRRVLAADLQVRFHNCLLPFFSYEYLSMSARCPRNFLRLVSVTEKKNTDVVRYAILEKFDLNLWDIGYGVHAYNWGLSDQRKAGHGRCVKTQSVPQGLWTSDGKRRLPKETGSPRCPRLGF